jgi:hypothetical protein
VFARNREPAAYHFFSTGASYMHLARLRVGGFLALATFALVACTGGGGGTTVPPASTPTPSAPPFPTPAAAQNSAVVSLTGASVTNALPPTGGIAATLTLPASTGNATLTVTIATGTVASTQAHNRSPRAATSGPLPNGPYLATIAFTPDRSVTLHGKIGALFDLGKFLNPDQTAALAFLSAAQVTFYAGLQDANGVFVTAGPLAVSGTVVNYLGPDSDVTIVGGGSYRIGIRVGPFPPIAPPSPSASASPIPSPSASPSPSPTSSPTPTASSSPSPSASPIATPTSSASGTILSQGATVDPVNGIAGNGALLLPYAGGFSGAIGYPTNDSNVVTVSSQSFNGRPQGGPGPPQGTNVDYAVIITAAGGPPSNQQQLTFIQQSGSVSGFLNVPFATTSTYTVRLYAGNGLVYTSPSVTPSATGSNSSRVSFTSPLNNLQYPIPLPQTLYAYFTRP